MNPIRINNILIINMDNVFSIEKDEVEDFNKKIMYYCIKFYTTDMQYFKTLRFLNEYIRDDYFNNIVLVNNIICDEIK